MTQAQAYRKAIVAAYAAKLRAQQYVWVAEGNGGGHWRRRGARVVTAAKLRAQREARCNPAQLMLVGLSAAALLASPVATAARPTPKPWIVNNSAAQVPAVPCTVKSCVRTKPWIVNN